MALEDIIGLIFSLVPSYIIKIILVIPLLLHLAFSLILVRQTKLMTEVVEAGISSVILTISFIHLLFSVFVLLWAVLFL